MVKLKTHELARMLINEFINYNTINNVFKPKQNGCPLKRYVSMLLNLNYLPLIVPFCAVYTIWGSSADGRSFFCNRKQHEGRALSPHNIGLMRTKFRCVFLIVDNILHDKLCNFHIIYYIKVQDS